MKLFSRTRSVVPTRGSIAIAAAEAGTAAIVFDRDRFDVVDVTTIERFAAGLDPVVSWLASAIPAVDKPFVVIDVDGLGQALWDRLGVRHGRGWRLYDRRGRDRQELVNALLVAQSEGRIRIHPSRHGDALRKALLAYHRTVGDDGVVGGELVVALALAAAVRRPAKPRVY